MDAIPADVWPCIMDKLPSPILGSLAASKKACWQSSRYIRKLTLQLTANEQLHGRMVSLLYFLTSRREHLQVRCLQ